MPEYNSGSDEVRNPGGSQKTDEERVTIKKDFWGKIVLFFTHLLFPGRFIVEL